MKKSVINLVALALTILILAIIFIASKASKDYNSIPGPGLYPAGNHVNIKQGTIACWVKLAPNSARRDHVIFNTDDSRIVLFLDTFGPNYVRFGARAGGNLRIVDNAVTRQGNFPEASIVINNDNREISMPDVNKEWFKAVKFPENEWHLLAMAWQGYPTGIVRIYLDGALQAEKPYDSSYDDSRTLFTRFSVGFNPGEWTGEMRHTPFGVIESKPRTDMSLATSGISINDLRIYKRVLSEYELSSIAAKRPDY